MRHGLAQIKHRLTQIKLIFTDFLFPSFCSLCDVKLTNANEIKFGLCEKCRKGVILQEGEKCKVCGKPLISEIDTCLSCRNQSKRSFDRLWVIYPYIGKYREVLAQYKFQKKLPLANFFAEQISPILNEPELKDTTLVPVPPRPGKTKEQGWDQIEHLVKQLKKQMPKISVCRCLKRKKSHIQKELNREERLENLKGRIFTTGKVPKTALIIDDVITTGATIEACASVLKDAGAEKVYGLCLFYD